MKPISKLEVDEELSQEIKTKRNFKLISPPTHTIQLMRANH